MVGKLHMGGCLLHEMQINILLFSLFACSNVQRTNEQMVSCLVERHARMAAAISFSADE